jgi:hypothetical protein
MFILSEFEGSIVNLGQKDRNLYQALLRIADIALKEGFTLVIDERIQGKIEVNLNEPYNMILIEILTGLDLMTIVDSKTIIISYR